jgi:hypothetical protein
MRKMVYLVDLLAEAVMQRVRRCKSDTAVNKLCRLDGLFRIAQQWPIDSVNGRN